MGVKVNITKKIGTMVDRYGKLSTKEDYIAKKEGTMGSNMGGDRRPNRISEKTGKIESGQKK